MAGAKAKASMVMTQSQWSKWAQQREADAPKVQKLYERQARQVREMLVERGCADCDPSVVLAQGEHGGPNPNDPQITHSMFCPNNN